MLKLATIGSGPIVHMMLEAVKLTDGIELYAVYSRKKETAQVLADKFQAQVIYTDLNEMLSDEQIDCVYVASPNSLHFEQSLAALKAKKHVLCEKPFTSTLEQLDQLIQTARENHVYLMEAITSQHLPNYHEIKKNLDQLGQLKMVQCNFSQYSSKYDAFLRGENPNVFNPVFSGGALSDINIYNLHFCIGLFGLPESMKYYPNVADNGIDTSGTAILSYPDFVAVCTGCKDSRSSNMVQIQGDKGYLVVESESSHLKNGFSVYTKETSNHYQFNEQANWMYYETSDFVQMIVNHDDDLFNKFMDESRQVIQAYETLRKEANIFFACDQK